MSYQLNWEPKGVFWKYNGDVTGQEIIDATSQIYGDARFDDLKYKIVDFLAVNSIKMGESDIALIAYQHKAAELSNPSVKTAILIERGNRYVEQFVSFFKDSTWEVEVFENENDANIWLKRKPNE